MQLSRRRKAPLHDAVCFHSQQCLEKYLKARLCEAGVAIPKTHDLEKLLDLVLSAEPFWTSFRPALQLLTSSAVELRYPGAVRDQTRSAPIFVGLQVTAP